MNVYDSARMSDVLAPYGYLQTMNPEEADLVILNTCNIREKAAEKMYSELGRLNKIKMARRKNGKQMLLAVGGCVGQAEGKEILLRAPYVDLVMGPQNYHRLPSLIREAESHSLVDIEFPKSSKFDYLPGESITSNRQNNISVFLTIQEGCDRFCTFCVVPYTRGSEYSRPVQDIESEARRLVGNGAKEITLLGQNVNSYHGRSGHIGNREFTLADLICQLANIKGLDRIRYTTSHPCDLTDDLIEAHRDIPNLMPFLHLPVQSGSNRILEAMNRRHTVEYYKQQIQSLRKARPDIAISSDFIVGYPGETDSDFEKTLELVEDIGFAQSFSFKYSPRPGTPAAEDKDSVPEVLKGIRLKVLQKALTKSQTQYNISTVGQTLPVIFERSSQRNLNQLIGKTPYAQWLNANLPKSCLGQTLDILITKANTNRLEGESMKYKNISKPLTTATACR